MPAYIVKVSEGAKLHTVVAASMTFTQQWSAFREEDTTAQKLAEIQSHPMLTSVKIEEESDIIEVLETYPRPFGISNP